MDYLIEYISNQTNLEIGKDIQLISNDDHNLMYKYLNDNLNKVQYGLAFCYGR